jgi:peptidyl-prolyl cis-trans isomerase B (cyclophilin B)
MLAAVIAYAPPKLPIVAQYVYNGINREFPVEVNAPRRSGKLTLAIVEPESGKVLLEAPTKGGKQDLSKTFPDLWGKPNKAVSYLELRNDGKKVGTELVLQPMTNPAVCILNAETKNPQWSPDEDNTYAGIRAWPNQNVLMETDQGNMEYRMRPDCAPNTVFNFVQLIQGGFYRDVIFHRIVSKHPRTGKQFVIQAGDPTGTGSGSPGYSFILEKSKLPHDFGVLGMARSTDPNTNGSQFYVALSREATQHLDGRYVTYGQLVKGEDVVKKIAGVEIGPKDDRPVKPPVIKRISLVNPG